MTESPTLGYLLNCLSQGSGRCSDSGAVLLRMPILLLLGREVKCIKIANVELGAYARLRGRGTSSTYENTVQLMLPRYVRGVDIITVQNLHVFKPLPDRKTIR